MTEKRIIITGATGMVGGCALRICLENPDVSLVTAIGRSHTGINDSRLQEVVVDDFTDYSALSEVLASLNAAFPGEENNDMFFTIWYGVYKKSTRELTYASGGHPPALLIGDTDLDDSRATPLRTPNNVIGAMPDVTYKKNKHLVGEQTTLYIFSDGVYEVEKSDGSMWQFNEFADFMNKIKTVRRSRLDHLYQHVNNIGNLENFEDDFTILEVAFG